MLFNRPLVLGGAALFALLTAVPQRSDAATPTVFSTAVAHPNGLAATQGKFLVTTQDNPNIVIELGANGLVITNPFATLPAGLPLQEVYLVVAPGVAGSGFVSNDVYAVRGNKIFKIPSTGGAAVLFATLPVADVSHAGITFDRVGTWGLPDDRLFRGRLGVLGECGWHPD